MGLIGFRVCTAYRKGFRICRAGVGFQGLRCTGLLMIRLTIAPAVPKPLSSPP